MLGSSAKDIMTRDVMTIRKSASVEDVLKLMADNRISGLPVVDQDGRLEGIITESDLLLKGQATAPRMEKRLAGRIPVPREVVEDMYSKSRAATVGEAMTPKVITFSEESAVTDIARVMIENKINRVPILRDGIVVGIVSRSDIVRAMADMVNAAAEEGTLETSGGVIELS